MILTLRSHKKLKAQPYRHLSFILKIRAFFLPYLKRKKWEEFFDSPFPGRTRTYMYTKMFRAQESKRQETGFFLKPLLSRLRVYFYRKVECAENCGYFESRVELPPVFLHLWLMLCLWPPWPGVWLAGRYSRAPLEDSEDSVELRPQKGSSWACRQSGRRAINPSQKQKRKQALTQHRQDHLAVPLRVKTS